MGDLGAKYGFYGEDPGYGGAGEVRTPPHTLSGSSPNKALWLHPSGRVDTLIDKEQWV